MGARSTRMDTIEETRLQILREIAAAFDRHDLDGIMRHFAEDCVFEAPRGPDAHGQRFTGKDAVRRAFAGRFTSIPDIRYTEDSHFVAGDRGASEWLLSGTTVDDQHIEVRGCDLWTFRGGSIVRKNSYWKIRS
jgi:ketosteroid isomerase-like protein